MADGGGPQIDWAEIKRAADEGNRAITEFRGIVDEVKGRISKIEPEKMAAATEEVGRKLEAHQQAVTARLDAIETKMRRPGSPGDGPDRSEYDTKFVSYLRRGDAEAELKSMQKSMSSNVDPDGGFLVMPSMAQGIQARLRRSSPMRELARAVVAPGGYDMLVERGDAGSGWVGETETPAETATPTINKINIPTEEHYARALITLRLVDTAEFDVEGELVRILGDRFRRQEATAFVAGNGVRKPKGFLSYATAATADETRANGVLQHRLTGVDGAFPDLDATTGVAGGDPLVKLYYDFQEGYQGNLTWLMKNTTAAVVAVLKDAQGDYLMRSMLNSDGTALQTIMGRPVRLANDMPALQADALSIALGDFQQGYLIVDGPGFRLLRDPYSTKPFVEFYVTKLTGGGVTDFDAIKFLKFGD